MVLDLVARRLTHVVVQSKHRHDAGRLVPVGLVDPTAVAIGLSCTTTVFATLPTAEESEFLPEWNEYQGYRRDGPASASSASSWPSCRRPRSLC